MTDEAPKLLPGFLFCLPQIKAIQFLLSRGFPLSHNFIEGKQSSAINYLVHGVRPCSKELRCRLLSSRDLACSVRHRWHFRQPAMGLPGSDRWPALPSGCEISASSAPMHSDAPPAPSGSGTRNVSDNTNNIEHQAVTTFSKMINDEKSWAKINLKKLHGNNKLEEDKIIFGTKLSACNQIPQNAITKNDKEGKSRADSRQLEIILKSSEFSCLSKK